VTRLEESEHSEQDWNICRSQFRSWLHNPV